MKRTRPAAAAAVAGMLTLGGCGGNAVLTLDDLVGTWTAVSMLFAAEDNSLQVDIVQLGGTFEIELLAGGMYTTTFTELEGATPEIENGTVALAGATPFGVTVTLTEAGGVDTRTFHLEKLGDTITMTGSDTFQFPGTQFEAPVNITAALTRD